MGGRTDRRTQKRLPIGLAHLGEQQGEISGRDNALVKGQ